MSDDEERGKQMAREIMGPFNDIDTCPGWLSLVVGVGLVVGLAILLFGCATPAPTPEPIIRTIEVMVPVPVKCTPRLDPEPDYPDTDAALADATLFRGVAILKAGRLMRIARDAELKAALAGCAATP